MKRGMMRIASVVMSVTVAMSTFGLGGTTATAAGLPTTDGHDKYVDKAVFDVIGSDTFGTKPLDNPLFDKTKGSSDITNLQVPVLAYDDTSIGVVWNKPEKYDNVADYKVWVNGELKETARENFKKNSAWTATYMEAFYDYYNTQGKSDVEMVNVDIHSFRATNLKPDTEYTIKVVAIDKDGKELGEAKEIKQKTTKTPEVVNIKDFGAETSEGYTTYDDTINAFVEKNTKAIQSAIDACPEGGKVVVPEGIFVTGALWLKSDMTLEVNGTLWASPNSDHFEIGFLMYPFYTDTRGWGLVNAMSADESAPIKNVRVTGNGTLYGNGWKYGSGSTIDGDGFTSNKGKHTQSGDPTDKTTWGLPRYCGGGNINVFYQGIQSKDSSYKYLKNTGKYTEAQIQALIDAQTSDQASKAVSAMGLDKNSSDIKNAYATRSSLLIMRNCENVYVGDITIENPSNHSVNILDSRKIATTNVKVFSFDGNNGDGLGFGCSMDVICWGNFTDTGDDNLGFGSSVGEGARDCNIQTNSEIWMFDNFIREGHGGLAAGSHTGNGIQDVLFEDTVMNHIDMAFRFKSAPTNGGFGANITMRDCAVADTNQGWVLTTSYGDPNSASSTEWAEIGEFYNFASYNVTVNRVVQNTIQVLADIDPVGSPSKPLHSHHNLYFQDITFGDVGVNGSYKNKAGWETLIGCDNSVFYNVKTVSYNSKAVSAKTDKAWSNLQYCNNLIFQGTTMESLNAYTDKMNAAMSPIVVTDNKITAENVVPSDEGDDEEPDDSSVQYQFVKTWTGADIVAAQNKEDAGLNTYYKKDVNDTSTATESKWTDGGDAVPAELQEEFGTGKAAKAGGVKAMDKDAATQSKGTIPASGCYITYTATQNGKLRVASKTSPKKKFFVVDSDGNVMASKDVAEGQPVDNTVLEFKVKAGKTYYIYANGETGQVYGISFLKAVKVTVGAVSKIYDAPATTTKDGLTTNGSTWSSKASGGIERKVKLTWTPVTNDTPVFYGVDTYVDGVKVDTIDGITDPTATIGRLSSGVAYTFKVYVSEKGDNANSMSTTGINKTLVGETTITVDGDKDTGAIEAADTKVSLASAIYTCAHGTWTNVSKQDARVRGYKIYANGNYIKTLYNYQISKYTTVDTVTSQVGRLTPGINNKVQIVAFTDAGVEYKYPEATVETLKNYDYKAPVWAADAKLTAEVKGSDVVLTWPAATDDTKVGGYRVYVDGVPVYADENTKAFNPVNGTKTTTDTTYTLTGLDLTKSHTITVQAGDTWWKAEEGMGSYDKMAGFNWTVKGLSVQVGEGSDDFMYGDLNDDGEVNILDAVLIKKVCAQMDVQYNKKAADVKVDGKIDSTDAVLLVKYCAKMDIVLGQK